MSLFCIFAIDLHLTHVEAGKTVSMDEKTRIVVPEDRYGLYAIDVLDPDMVRFLFSSSHIFHLVDRYYHLYFLLINIKRIKLMDTQKAADLELVLVQERKPLVF